MSAGNRSNDVFDLTGSVSIVTGGCGLLGPRLAEILAGYGSRVVLVDSDAKPCEDAASNLGSSVIAIPCDITRKESVDAMVQQVMDKFGRIDVLVNNAAKKSPNFYAPLEDFPLSDWNEVMAVNVTGVFLCCQSVGRRMVERASGSIINIASIYGIVGPDPRIYEGSEFRGVKIGTPPVYSASKGAVLALTRHLATHWGARGVRANAITPGGVASGQNETFVRRYSERVPLGRMARPDDLHGALLFLASPASRYVTGHNLIVDGGWTAW
jgi:NAD(P)-dependent dehydrogenase (short-subunit alcohol dehydrogenase family)